MKQYCRYCIHLITGNGTWCDAKKKTIRDNTCRSGKKSLCMELIMLLIQRANTTEILPCLRKITGGKESETS